ncbi:hypothetical protein QYM36_004950 [Artemia franciscana]|uniref:Uncharacterized protein n=1 Tax=Artemia franciscana TaxID=6661 RepID=A0AA88HY60_ARTSF|nr:hypothetical protein QYM36_004950 [Artemia franciscana]
MFMKLPDGDVSEMSDLSDSDNDESDSQYLPPNPKLTDFCESKQLEPMRDSSPPNNFLESHDLEEPGPSTSFDRATDDQQPSANKLNR